MLRTAEIDSIEGVLSSFHEPQPIARKADEYIMRQHLHINEAYTDLRIIIDSLRDDSDGPQPPLLLQVYTLVLQSWNSISAWMFFSIRFWRLNQRSLLALANPLALLQTLFPNFDLSFLSEPIIQELLLHPRTTQLAAAFVILKNDDGMPFFVIYPDKSYPTCPIIKFIQSLSIADRSTALTLTERFMMLPRPQLVAFVKAWTSRSRFLAGGFLKGASEVPKTAADSLTTLVLATQTLAQANSTFDNLLLQCGYFRDCAESLSTLVNLAVEYRTRGWRGGALGPEEAEAVDGLRVGAMMLAMHIFNSFRSSDAFIQAVHGGLLTAAVQLEKLPKTKVSILEESMLQPKAFGGVTRWVIPLLTSRRVLEVLRQIAIDSPDSPWVKRVKGVRARDTAAPLTQDTASIARAYLWASTCVLDLPGIVRVNQCINLKVRRLLQEGVIYDISSTPLARHRLSTHGGPILASAVQQLPLCIVLF